MTPTTTPVPGARVPISPVSWAKPEYPATFLLSFICLWFISHALAADAASESADAARRAINLEVLSRLKGTDLETNPAVKSVVLRVLEQLHGTAEFVKMVRDFNLKGQTQPLLELAVKDPSGPAGVDAMRLVLSTESPAALKPLLDGTNAANLAEALGNTGQKEIVPLLLPLISEPSRPFDVRKRAVQALAKTRAGTTTLLELARAKKLPEDLRPIASSELNVVRWDPLRAQAAELVPLTRSENTHVLPPIAELVKLSGDSQKGAAVFRRDTVGCFKCHLINGEGTDFGPNLSEIGTKLAKPAIYESILDPSAGIAFGYEAWQIDLKNGDDVLGLIVSETADELALKTVGGIVTRYKKADITSRTKQKMSIMPTGFEQTMSSDDLVNLVEYLASLKKAAK